MLGFRLFLHALKMIVGNLSAAIRISTPIIVLFVLALIALTIYGPDLAERAVVTSQPGGGVRYQFDDAPAGLIAAIAGFMVLWSVAFLAVAVAWHRYILLEESPGALGPRWNGGAMLRYVFGGIVLGFILLFALIPILIISGMVILPIAVAFQSTLLGVVAMAVFAYVPLTIIFYRLAPILPSSAIGRRIEISQAWNATRGAGGTVLVLALISVLGVLALAAPTQALNQISPVLGLVWRSLTGWIQMMMGVSILSTLYGYFIERRELNA